MKIKTKVVAYLFVLFFVLSMIPIVYCGFFDYANGDDLIGSATAHNLFRNGTNIFEYFYNVCQDVRSNYYLWGGNWSSTFVWFAFQPSIFAERLYVIVPIIAYIMVGGCTAYSLVHFLKKYMGFSKYPLIIVISSILFFMIQYAPFIRPMFFWWTGMVVYMIPFGLMGMSLVWADFFIETGKVRYAILLVMAFVYIGGAGYFTAIVSIEIFGSLLTFMFIKEKSFTRNGILYVLAYILLLISFVISYLAPGNTARAISEGTDISMSLPALINTVFSCIQVGIREFFMRFIEIRPLFLLPIVIFVVSWKTIKLDGTKQYRHPILFTVFLLLVYCSSYAPMLFAGTSVSGGGPDNIFFFFILVLSISEIYCVGAYKRWRHARNKDSWFDNEELFDKYLCIPVSILVLIFVTFCFKLLIGNSSWYLCKEFISTGQLKDFYEQMEERISILESDEKDVILPMMSDEQGPFMHMPLIEDPDGYPNRATAKFYDKNSVIAIPRDEWNCEYKNAQSGK